MLKLSVVDLKEALANFAIVRAQFEAVAKNDLKREKYRQVILKEVRK